MFLCFIFFLLPLAVVLWAMRPLFIPRVRTHKSVAQVKNLLNPPRVPLSKLLDARAIPNQRLVQAFGLTNTFVSGDPKVHKTFTASAKVLISGDTTWRSVSLSAEAIATRFLPVQRETEFAKVLQCITFSIMFSILFDTHLDSLRYEDVLFVTDTINKRWTDSKLNGTTKCQDSLHDINAIINRWLADHDRYPNPLNFIIPAYETMWRVVAVTVAYIYRYRDDTLQNVAMSFGKNPTEEGFEAFGEDGKHPSMQAIVLEVLRLHPPTRHIARVPSMESASWWNKLVAPVIEIGDIESVHLSNGYGENTREFDPMRFHPSRMNGRQELFSFGYGRLRCIAATWAPMAAAVIAAKIVERVEETGSKITVGSKIGGRTGWDGWTVGKE